MLVNTCSYNGGAGLIYISVRVQKSKRKGAFQVKLAPRHCALSCSAALCTHK